jgi:hypothetical protein
MASTWARLVGGRKRVTMKKLVLYDRNTPRACWQTMSQAFSSVSAASARRQVAALSRCQSSSNQGAFGWRITLQGGNFLDVRWHIEFPPTAFG